MGRQRAGGAPLTVWVFILLFHLPSFGGDTRIRFEFQTQDGCERIQKVVIQELQEKHMKKFDVIQDCTPETRP